MAYTQGDSGWRLAVSGWDSQELKGEPETGRYAADIKIPSQSSGLRFPFALTPCTRGHPYPHFNFRASFVFATIASAIIL
jgi:hypothetical protein